MRQLLCVSEWPVTSWQPSSETGRPPKAIWPILAPPPVILLPHEIPDKPPYWLLSRVRE